MSRDGILLMNVGTPDEPTVDSVKTYLREFLLDPDVIDIPAPLRHLLVRGIILRTRPKKIAPRYDSIWMDGGSPLRVYTQRICDKLQIRMEDSPCIVGMRYGNPSIRSALEDLRNQGVTRLMLAPLFPHYAQATTESSIKHAYKQLNEMNWTPDIIEFGHFETEDEFIVPLAESIRPHIDTDTHLLFSYHGLPISHVKRIDSSKKHCQKVENCCEIACDANALCYGRHCSETTYSVVEKLGLGQDQWSMSYQSRLGPVKWLEPSTTNKVKELVERGIKKIVVVAPAFLADGLETLEELDIELREDFIEMGGEELIVVKCLNDNDQWIDGLESLVRKRLDVHVA